jgi:aspartate 1-decarboxylase
VVDVDNGERFVTYVIEGKPGSGVMCVNGAAARLVSVGDRIIVIAYGQVTKEEARTHRPRVVLVDDANGIKDAYELKPGAIDPGAPLPRA